MRSRKRIFIDDQEAAYLELLIGENDPELCKGGLQRLCKLYRSGHRHRRERALIVFVVGLLHDSAAKVRRWALNLLALAGSADQVPAIVETLKRDRADPDIVGAGISALCALLPEDEARDELKRAELPLDAATLLAATQQSNHFSKELRVTRVNIDNADEPILRLSGILVGLDKAPENLFGLKFENRAVIGQLNQHPDRIVAQYSVWAINENPRLGHRDLTIKLADIAAQPTNVRKYYYQTIVSDVKTAMKNREGIVVGSEDLSEEARGGLATGLRYIYYDSLEEVVLDWYEEEASDSTKQRLLEHMATQSDKCSSYGPEVIRVYRTTTPNSLTRARLEAAARNTELYTEMKKITYKAEGEDLFGSDVFVSPRQLFGNERTHERALKAKVLIITALPKETAAVRATFDRSESFGIAADPNVYEFGTYEGPHFRNVVLASSGMGKANAASVTTNALRSLPDVEHIIFVGIAGGCPNSADAPEHVRLGDIVLSGAAGIIEYDFVKETEEGRETRASPQKPSARILGIANALIAGANLDERPWEDAIQAAGRKLTAKYRRPDDATDVLHDGNVEVAHPVDAERRVGQPKVHLGGIATADTLQKNAAARDRLRQKYNARAIEMEAAGSQAAAWAAGKQVFVVRGICDYCDSHKNDLWQEYAALTAAGYSRALIERMPHDWL